MTPLIDVVFLLLTFFILSMLVTVRADVLPVQLSPVGTGEQAEPGRSITAITIDARGDFYLDREPVTEQELDQRMAEWAETPADERPRIFVALEESLQQAEQDRSGEARDADAADDEVDADEADADADAGDNAPAAVTADRGPIVLRLIERLRRAGLTDVSFIGDRGEGSHARRARSIPSSRLARSDLPRPRRPRVGAAGGDRPADRGGMPRGGGDALQPIGRPRRRIGRP